MIPVIAGWKHGVLGVFPFEHAGRVGDTDEEHRVLAGVGRRFLHRAAGMLLEDIVDVLHAGGVAVADAIDAFVEPADGRPERDAVVTNFSALLQFFERGPERVVGDLLHLDVVQLEQIDAVGLQPLQRRIRRAGDGLR